MCGGCKIMAKKKVYFFKVGLYDNNNNELDYHLLKKLFMDIINNNATIQENYFSLDLTLDDDIMHIMWDVFEYQNTRLFGRLSRQTPSNSIIQRDYRTYVKEDVLPCEDEKNMGIEKYTYGSLDYNTGIFSFVSSKGTPTEKVICNAISKYANDFKIEIFPIPNANAIETIYQEENSEITRVEIEIPKPNPGDLENLLGWDENKIMDTVMDRNLTASIVIKPLTRRTSLTYDAEESRSIINLIKNRLSGYNKAKIKAKSRTISLRDFNLFDENFSYPIDITPYHVVDYNRINYTVDELVNIYKQNLVLSFLENKEILTTIADRE